MAGDAVRRPGGMPTRIALRWLLAALLVVATLVIATSAAALAAMRRTAGDYQQRGQPSVAAVAAARQALVEADLAAVNSLTGHGGTLVGPGAAYQNQVSVVTQSLARVAEHNVAGTAGSQLIELVDGLLVAYTALIEHADAYCRLGADCPLGQVYLAYAGNLLGDLLSQLDTLRKTEDDAVTAQLATGGTSVPWVMAWVVPCLALLVLLVLGQVFLRRRFRRRVSPALAVAAVVLIAVVAAMALSVHARRQIGSSREQLAAANTTWHDWQGRIHGRRAATGSDAVDQAAAQAIQLSGDRAARAMAGTADPRWVAGGTLLVAALIVAGLIPRIEEYRYRSR